MEEYKYKKVPLTPSVIENLIVELFNGNMKKRDEIVHEVLNFHLKNGGLPPEVRDFPRSVKKALENMAEKEWVLNRSYGYWEVKKENAPMIEEYMKVEVEEDIDEEEILINHVYGSGNSAVYLYYYESYKELSLLQDKRTWPCKIGRTDRDPLIRILSQASTALPETPTIDFIIKTDNASLLETTIHSILKLKGKHLENSPGSEWFDTNPEEIIKFIDSVSEDLLYSQ
ncbi:GIY-YIG nuclease family protein [Halobacillus sp. B23F22_1]|uniref:GIY-YIG nuclease family protein n=1 Tax=Halobacillus sp. B23F22_1 TaxID=3459514 RepID=UPI00373EF971